MNDIILDIDLDTTAVAAKRSAIQPTGKLRKLFKPLGDNDYCLEIDWSSLEKFQTCDRLGLYTLVFSRSTYEAASLIYGRAFHKALEFWHGMSESVPNSDERRTQAIMEGERVLSETPALVGEWRNLENFMYAFTKYTHEYPHERWKIASFDNESLVERAFATHLGTIAVNEPMAFPMHILVEGSDSDDIPFVRNIVVSWTGIVDGVIEDVDGLWAIDHKTTSIGGDSYFRQFELSQQFIGYTWAASQIMSQRLKGTLLNVIFSRKPTRTGKTVECSRRYYEYSDFKRIEWHNDIMTMCEDFILRLTTGNFPKKTSWCVNKFGTCPFMPVCAADSEEERNVILASDLYAPNVWNPLDTGKNKIEC